jgi:Holliday junction resolvase RusA-like endonuclease
VVVPRQKKPFVHHYLSPEATQYKHAAKIRTYAAGWRQPITKPTDVRLEVTWHRRHRLGDLDNRLKGLLDALEGLLYEDDKQIVEIVARVVMDSRDYMEVGVEAVSGEQLSLEDACDGC